MVQAGANNQLGGRYDDLTKCSYHSPGEKAAPVDAARAQAAAKPISTRIEAIFIL